MPNAANSASETTTARPKDAPEATFDAAEASENAARGVRLDATAAAALLAPPGARLRSTAPQAPGPPDPKRRSSADPGNGAEASASDASGSASAGRPPLPTPSTTG